MQIIKRVKQAAVIAAISAASAVYAEVPAAVTDAISEGREDVLAVGGVVLTVVVALAGIRYIKSAIRG